MIADIKLALGMDGADFDGLFVLMIRDAEQAILDYCHINQLPPQLQSLVRELVVQEFKRQNEGGISSVKRGDTQVSYTEPIGAGCFTDKQIKRLNSYRKWRIR